MYKYVMKNSGKKKARKLCNWSPMKINGVNYSNIYAACVFQYSIKIFLDLEISLIYDIIKTDVTNAYDRVEDIYLV